MRLRSNPRAERLLRRLPRLTALSAVELALLALIAVQAARLVWILVTPVGPVGDWRPVGALTLPATHSGLTDFDPFFRLSGGGAPATITSLNLRLYGVREDRATGRGSAIIALPNGSQRSFAVGEEIIPGVTLAAVGFDNVTVNRGGAPEQLFLGQSEPTRPGDVTQPPQVAAPAPVPPPARMQTEVPVPSSPTAATAPIVATPPIPGLEPGDVVVAVNGRPVRSPEQALAAVRAAGGPVNVIVNRGGRAVPLQVRPDR